MRLLKIALGLIIIWRIFAISWYNHYTQKGEVSRHINNESKVQIDTFYLEALDRDEKKPNENPSIGVLLCKSNDDEVVEYALSRSLSPTMVAEYELKLPDKALLQHKMQEIAELVEEEKKKNRE